MTDSDIAAAKKRAIRKRVRALRDAAPPADRAAWSAAICAQALAMPAYAAARTVHAFLSFQSEIDTAVIIEHALVNGKRVVVPVFTLKSDATPCTRIDTLNRDVFEFGKWNMRIPKVLHPVPLDEIDIVFAPMVAWATVASGLRPAGGTEPAGYARVGYGAGYYDRFLVRLRLGVPRIGLAFALQRVDEIPIEPHDVLLDDVLTNLST
jgi:5-formyltetrahydrofolate cyclo-ligase